MLTDGYIFTITMYYCIPVSFAQYIFFSLGKDNTIITCKYVIRN